MINRFLKWLDGTKAWELFAKHIIAKFTFRWFGYTKFPVEKYFDIEKAMIEEERKGPGIFAFACSDDMSLASVLIRWITGKGTYSHAGLLERRGPGRVFAIHMKGDGVRQEHLLRVLKEVDVFTVVRIKMDKKSLITALGRISYVKANTQEITYDFEQELGSDKAIYCSELVYKTCEGLIEGIDGHLKSIAGRRVFDPDAVAKIGKVVFSNNPKESK
jgi:hypothetical protein